MKRKFYSICLMLGIVVAFLLPSKVNGQNCPGNATFVDTIVSAGTTSNSIVPFGSFSSSQYEVLTSWTVYSKSELEAVGITPGSIIREIGFKKISGTDYPAQGLTIYFLEVPIGIINEVSDTVSLSDMHLVFSSSLETFTTGWNYLSLDSQYVYMGAGNLMVAIHRSGQSFDDQSYFHVANGKTLVKHKSVNNETYLNSMMTKRASIALRACVDSTICPAAEIVSCNSIGTTAIVALQPQEVQHNVVVGYSGFNPDTVSAAYPFQSSLYADTIMFTMLEAGTLYDVYARSICNGIYSLWDGPMSFRTNCGVQTTPYTNACINASTVDSCLVLHNAQFSTSPSAGLYRISANQKAMVVLPQFDTPVNTLHVSFVSVYNNNGYEVGVMTNPYDTNTFIPYDTVDYANPIETDFHRYSGPEGRVAIRWDAGRLRNIVVDTIQECFIPYAVTIDYDTGRTATVHWRNRAANVTEYQVTCRPAGSQDWTYRTTTETHFTLDSLEYGTRYEVYVGTLCNGSDHSNLQQSYFTTSCVPVTELPYQLNGNQLTTYVGFPYFSAPCWTYLLDSSTYTAIWVLPEMDTTDIRMDQLKLTYNIRYQYAYSGIQNHSTRTELEIGVMDNDWDTNTFVPFDTASLVSNVSNYFSGEMVVYCPLRQGKHLAFRSPQGLIMDVNSLKIEENLCHPVRDIVLTNRSSNTLTVNWREQGNATQWLVQYSAAGGTQTGSSLVTSKPYTIAGLQQYTSYNITVRAINGSDTSEACSAQFRTTPDSLHTTTMIQIGNPSTDNHYNYPVRRSEKHTWSQTLYPLSQYSTPGIIDTVWFYCKALTPGTGALDTSLTLYMGHWPLDHAESAFDWVPMSSLHQVFHTSEWRATGPNRWVPIVLDSPFYYNGVDELALVFAHSNSTTRGSGDYYTYSSWITPPLGANLSVGGSDDSLAHHPCVGIATSRTVYRPDVRFSILTSTCLSIRNLNVANVNLDTVWLTWQERGGASQWQVAYTDEDGNRSTVIVDNLPQCSISGLASNKTYTFQVRPICSEGDTGYFYGNATAYIETCPIVNSVAVSNVSQSTATVSWHENGSATMWEVSFIETGSSEPDAIHSGVVTVTGNPTTELTGLHEWSTYMIRVRAVCGVGDSSLWSEPAEFTTHRGAFDYDVVQIGTIGSLNNYNAPFDSYYRHSWNQMIFPAEAIGFSGFIDTIWWNAATVGTNIPDTSVTIYMGHTTMTEHSTNIDWLPSDSLVQVFHGQQVQPTETGWFAIPLETSFFYNGNDNLVICVSTHCSDWSSAWKYCYNSVVNSFLFRRSDNDVTYGNHPGTNNGTVGSELPVTRLSMSGSNLDCMRPNNLMADVLSFDSVMVSWQGNESDSVYFVTLTAETGDTNYYMTYETSLPLYYLQPETEYNVSVASLCTSGMLSNSISAEFVTLERCPKPSDLVVVNEINADGVQLQWQDATPSGQWQVSYGVGLSDPTQGTLISTDTNFIALPPLTVGESYNAFVRRVCGPDDTSHWTVPVSFVSGVHYFDQTTSDTIVTCHTQIRVFPNSYFQNDTLVVYPSVQGSLVSVSGTVNLQPYNNWELCLKVYDGVGTDGTHWGTFTGIDTLPQLISTQGALTLVFCCHDYYDGGINVDVSCIADNGCHTSPKATVQNVLDTNAFMHWTYNDALPSSFTIAYAPYDDFDTADASTYSIVTGITDTAFLLTGLQPGTHYLAAVRAECGDNLISRWTISNDFYTACMAIPRTALPFAEDFSSWGSGMSILSDVVDPCWTYITTGSFTFVYHNSTQTSGITDFVELEHYGYTHSVLALPLFDDSITDLTVTFSAKNNYAGLYNQYVEHIEVGIMDNPHDITTYTTVWHDSLVGESWYNFSVPLSSYSGTGRYIAISAPMMAAYHSGYSLYVANVGVTMDLPCMPPLSVSVDSVDYTEAYISIVDTTSPDAHILLVGTSPDRDMATDSILFTGSTLTLSSLEEGTEYYVWVQNKMVVVHDYYYSPWTGPVSFTTLKHSTPVTFTAHAFSNNPAIGTADISCLEGSGATCSSTYLEGSVLLFTATPIGATSHFLHWNDGDTTNPRRVTLTQDTILTAYFAVDTMQDIVVVADVQVTIAPNPASESVVVSSEEIITSIVGYSVQGRQMLKQHIGSNSAKIDVSGWPAGIYLLKIKMSDSEVVRKLIVE